MDELGRGTRYASPLLHRNSLWALFVLLLSTLVCCQPTELILGSFFHELSNLTPPPPSTFDGHSIAYSVLFSLCRQRPCRTIFSTHYHGLCDDVAHWKEVRWDHVILSNSLAWIMLSSTIVSSLSPPPPPRSVSSTCHVFLMKKHAKWLSCTRFVKRVQMRVITRYEHVSNFLVEWYDPSADTRHCTSVTWHAGWGYGRPPRGRLDSGRANG